jgi:hypothetical protein
MKGQTDLTDQTDLIGPIRRNSLTFVHSRKPGAMPEITAQFTLTGEDYEAYLRYYYAQTKKGRRQMRRMYLVGLILYVWFMVMEYDHPNFGIGQPGYYAAYAVITAGLLGGGFWFFLNRIWPTLAQGAVKRSPQRGMFTETSLTFREDALYVKTSEGEGRMAWKGVERAEEDEGYIYLFMGGLNAFIIPKRGFEGNVAAAMLQIRKLAG